MAASRRKPIRATTMFTEEAGFTPPPNPFPNSLAAESNEIAEHVARTNWGRGDKNYTFATP